MFEELQMLVEMVAKLPTFALWILLGFLAYKLAIVGSVYGLIRFGIDKLHNYLITPKHTLKKFDIEGSLGSLTIANCNESLIGQISRIAGSKSGSSAYIHQQDVEFLREALNDAFEKHGSRKGQI